MINSEEKKKGKYSRSPIIAFLGTVFFPGFGQIYNGQLKKGVLFLSIILILPFIYGFTRLPTFFYGFVIMLIIDISFKIYIVYDATATARKIKNYTPKCYNTWYFNLLFISIIGVIIWFYEYDRALGVQSFQIPTSTNEPTIKVGDRLIADLKAFNNTSPNYGDFVIFQEEDNSLNFSMYRVVGLPGDKIKFENNFLIINNNKCHVTHIKDTLSDGYAVNEYEEELPNGLKHRIYTFTQAHPNNPQKRISQADIPANHYFLLGDNRNNALDSRHIGPVNKDKIKGKIVFGFWGNTKDRININYNN